jgi:hypothetical protein
VATACLDQKRGQHRAGDEGQLRPQQDRICYTDYLDALDAESNEPNSRLTLAARRADRLMETVTLYQAIGDSYTVPAPSISGKITELLDL